MSSSLRFENELQLQYSHSAALPVTIKHHQPLLIKTKQQNYRENNAALAQFTKAQGTEIVMEPVRQ